MIFTAYLCGKDPLVGEGNKLRTSPIIWDDRQNRCFIIVEIVSYMYL